MHSHVKVSEGILDHLVWPPAYTGQRTVSNYSDAEHNNLCWAIVCPVFSG